MRRRRSRDSRFSDRVGHGPRALRDARCSRATDAVAARGDVRRKGAVPDVAGMSFAQGFAIDIRRISHISLPFVSDENPEARQS